MNTFHDLYRHQGRQANDPFAPDERGGLFPDLIRHSPKFHLWAPGDPIPAHGHRLLIGVATWSGYDMELLDMLEAAPAGSVQLDVFDTDTCKTLAEIHRRVPGVGAASPTPLVGYWVDGRLVETAAGYDGRQLVARVCGLSMDEIVARMKSLHTRV